jgi:hypothetical protein
MVWTNHNKSKARRSIDQDIKEKLNNNKGKTCANFDNLFKFAHVCGLIIGSNQFRSIVQIHLIKEFFQNMTKERKRAPFCHGWYTFKKIHPNIVTSQWII